MSRSTRSSYEYNRWQRQVLRTYLAFIQTCFLPPQVYDDPLFTMLTLNDLSSWTLLLSLHCWQVFRETPETICRLFNDTLASTCRCLALLSLTLDVTAEQIWEENEWHDPRDFASSIMKMKNGGSFAAYVQQQLFGRNDQLVRRALDIQQGMKQLADRSFVNDVEPSPVKDALVQLWHSAASLAVNIDTELAQILIDDMECLKQEQWRKERQ